jgi:hypothetical protein
MPRQNVRDLSNATLAGIGIILIQAQRAPLGRNRAVEDVCANAQSSGGCDSRGFIFDRLQASQLFDFNNEIYDLGWRCAGIDRRGATV